MVKELTVKTNPTIMLIGLGGLGSVVLELLAREKGLGRIVVGSGSAALHSAVSLKARRYHSRWAIGSHNVGS